MTPRQFVDHDIIQKAAKSKNAFHIDDAVNGLPLSQARHGTGHYQYNKKIEQVLDKLVEDFPNMDYNDAHDYILGLNNHLKDLFNANPNLTVGQIADLINYP